MPNLVQSLQNHDLGHLRIVARLWGLELASAENEAVLGDLERELLNPKLVNEMVAALSAEDRAALSDLHRAGGKIAWSAFIREYGEIREAGAGQRDREQFHLHPISSAERLYYRAFLGRAFFDTPKGELEFAYIPEDLEKLISLKESDGATLATKTAEPYGRPATPAERERPIPASDRLLDDATTYLAALRTGHPMPEMPTPKDAVAEFLKAAGILEGGKAPADQVKSFLEMPRSQALDRLVDAWRNSEAFNELRLMPGLVCEGNWSNQPLAARRFLFGLLDCLPKGKWWSLGAFIQDIKARQPDFQRPAGDFDSWFVKRLADDSYLRGFSAWDDVDGALIRFTITGPMAWTGLLELAKPENAEVITAFQMSEKRSTGEEIGKLSVASNGRISVPRLVPRAARYLISRFCEWEQPKADAYTYHITTESLKKAGNQGLKPGQLLSLLARNAASDIPPAFVKALKRWESNGTEATLEVQTILKVSRPEVLDELRKTRAGRFLGESLGPVTAIIKPGAQARVLAALTEQGLLAEVQEPPI